MGRKCSKASAGDPTIDLV